MEIDPCLTRGEYWLLETAVTSGIPVSPILLSPEIDDIFNKPGHGMNSAKLEVALTSLAQRGLINLYHFSPNSEETRPATVAEVASGLAGAPGAKGLYYNLSSEGGLHWEAFARPSWDDYVDHSILYEDDGLEDHELFAASRQLLQRIFDGLSFVGVYPKPETVHWADVSPLRATYWKELACGSRVEFKSAPHKSFSWEDVPFSYYRIAYPRWYRWA